MNHESKIEDVDEAAPLSLSARVAIVSPFCLRVDVIDSKEKWRLGRLRRRTGYRTIEKYV